MKTPQMIVVVLGTLHLASCAVESSTVNLRHPCPAPPPLPVILETELQDLSDSVYRRLVERDMQRAEYIRLLEVYCDK